MSVSLSRPVICALLIDLSGTLHIGPDAIEGAVPALRHLRDSGIPIRFCSNTSKESTSAMRENLHEMGFEVGEGELWTSLGALRDLVAKKDLKKPYFLLTDSAMEEFPGHASVSSPATCHHSEYDSVVIGLSPKHLNYDALTMAFRVLSSSTSDDSSSSKPLVTTHRAKYIRTSDGELSLGPGPFVKALEEAMGAGFAAESVGKPGRLFFERVIGSFDNTMYRSPNSAGGKIAIIGDDIEADLGGGAIELGLWRVLVKTGKYRPGDEQREGQQPPDEVHPCLAKFIDSLLEDPRQTNY